MLFYVCNIFSSYFTTSFKVIKLVISVGLQNYYPSEPPLFALNKEVRCDSGHVCTYFLVPEEPLLSNLPGQRDSRVRC